MKLRIWIVCLLACLLTILAAAPGGAQALMPAPPGTLGGSWNWGLGFTGAWDFDTLIFVYRPSLDLGGGTFQSPFWDDFRYNTFGTGPVATGWGVTSASPVTVYASGPSLDGLYSSFWMRDYFSGDGTLSTGFDIGIYEAGSWVTGYQLEVGNSFSLFSATAISEGDFNQHLNEVPEPTTLGALGLGLITVFGRLRRRRNQV
jgi:hypothetical protein